MKNIKKIVNKFFSNIKVSFSYYPITIILCIVFAVLFIFRNEYMDFATSILKERIDTIFIGLGIAILSSMNIHLLIKGYELIKKNKMIVWIISFIFVSGYYWFAINDLSMITTVRAFVIMGVLFCTYLIIPWFSNNIKVEKFAVKMMIESIISYFYASVLFGGLMLIDFAFETLMDIHPTHEFVIFAAAFSYMIVLPMLIFSRIQEEYKQSKILKILIVNIIMPLLLAYTVVLYMYFIRMLILFEIPNNMITNLVFWYGIIGIFTLFIANLYEDDKKWLKVFTKYFPIITVIPIGIMFMALIIRMSNYGITEPRYTLFIIGIWTLLVMAYLFFTKKEKRVMVVLPISLALICLLIVASPFSMFNVSKTSQNNRFDKLYNNIENLNADQKSQLLSITEYFQEKHTLSDINNFPNNMEVKEFKEKYDLQYIYSIDDRYYGTNVSIENGNSYINTEGYSYMFYTIWEDIRIEDDNTFHIYYKKNDLVININDTDVLTIDTKKELNGIYEKYKNRETHDHQIILENELLYNTNGWKIKVIIGGFYINIREKNIPVKSGDIIVLIGKD